MCGITAYVGKGEALPFLGGKPRRGGGGGRIDGEDPRPPGDAGERGV